MLAESLQALTQGSIEWLMLRKTKITATDSAVILGVSHWKTKQQLFKEKMSDSLTFTPVTERMQRGLDLEPAARDLFCLMSGIEVFPKVVIKDWAMASLDGISDDGKTLIEIKCPGEKDHAMARAGKVPAHYYPQLQHQLYVTGLDEMVYISYDGDDGLIVEVKRDQEYIDKMVEKELEFYRCMQTGTPPDPDESDYIQRDDDIWSQCASNYKTISQTIKALEIQQEEIKKQLVFLAGESNSRGCGLQLCQITRKGAIDYQKIPELKGLDLEKYRKPASTSWRITVES